MPAEWPYPRDKPLARAKRIARAYRAKLTECDPQGCEELDRQFLTWGQGWMLGGLEVWDLDDWLLPGQAAFLAATTTANLRRLRLAGKLHGEMVNGLWRYQAREVIRVISATR